MEWNGAEDKVTVAALAAGRLDAKDASIGNQRLFPGPVPPSFYSRFLNENQDCWKVRMKASGLDVNIVKVNRDGTSCQA